jgi:2-keto-4-pentenoate hydratase/2-oxohepta-3-ene-1,7-dioic acid hydratase in catechol pathway
VSPEEAMKHIAGYCLALDMTDRQGQEEAKKESKPWAACKGWDTSLPVSDVVPISDVKDYKKFNIKAWVLRAPGAV